MSNVVTDNRSEGVGFVHEDDGSITAKDRETGLARGGQTYSESLANMAEYSRTRRGEGEPVENPDAFLRDLGIDPDEQFADSNP